MKSQTAEFMGAGFDAFALTSETQPDVARILAQKAAKEEAQAALEARQTSLRFFDTDSYKVAEIKVHVVRECATLATRKLDRPHLAADFFDTVVRKADWFDADKECVVVLLLDRKNQLKGWNLLTLGTMTASLVGPREVLRAAIVGNATAFVLMHNHPSGDPAPSAPDMHVTRILRDAAQAVELHFLDHVVVGTKEQDPAGRGYFSFREAGLL